MATLHNRRRRTSGGSPEPGPPEWLRSLQLIVASLWRLDLCAFKAIAETAKLSPDEIREEIGPHFTPLWEYPPPDLTTRIEHWLHSRWLLPPWDVGDIPGLLGYVETLPEAQIHEIITNASRIASVYHNRMIEFRRDKLKDMNMCHDHAGRKPDYAFTLNLGLRLGQKPDNVNDYLDILSRNRAITRADLSSSMDAVKLFRDQVTRAFNLHALDNQLLQSLRETVKELEGSFNSACEVLALTQERQSVLLEPSLHKWL
jgi:hypothetical protein